MKRSGFQERVRAYGRQILADAIARHGGNVHATCRELEMRRSVFYRTIKVYGVQLRKPAPVGQRMTPEFRRFLGMRAA